MPVFRSHLSLAPRSSCILPFRAPRVKLQVGASFIRVIGHIQRLHPTTTSVIPRIGHDSQASSWLVPGASSTLIMSSEYPTWSFRLHSRPNLRLASLHIQPLEGRILCRSVRYPENCFYIPFYLLFCVVPYIVGSKVQARTQTPLVSFS